MPNTTSFDFGDVILVRFPFTDQSSAKQRPAVVINSASYGQQRPDVILMAITSQVHPATMLGEATLTDWKSAGLLKASALKPIVTTVQKRLIRRRLGQLGAEDRKRLEACLHEILGPTK